MSDEKGKKAGGISKFKQQYGQIGGGKPSEHLDNKESENSNTQNPKSAEVQTSKMLNAQSVKSPEVQHSENPTVQQSSTPDVQSAEASEIQPFKPSTIQISETLKGQNMNSLAVQASKGTHKGRTQKTIYLPPALAKKLNFASVEEEREISEIVTDALKLYFDNNMRDNQ